MKHLRINLIYGTVCEQVRMIVFINFKTVQKFFFFEMCHEIRYPYISF